MIVELAEDFRDALAAMPKVHPRNRIVQLLDKAIRRDSSFIAQHPHLLLQCLWHTCYWYDSPKTPEHCVWNDPTEPEKPNWPWNQSGPKLCGFMFHWAEQVKQNGSMRQWLRSSGPGGAPLNSPLVATLRGHNGTVQCVAVTPDSRRIISGSHDRTIRLWDANSCAELAILRGHKSQVNGVTVTPDGRRIISGSGDTFFGGSNDNTVRVWDAESGAELAVFCGHERAVTGVAVIRDGRCAISGSWDGTIRVWDLASGTELAVLRGHGSHIDSVNVTPNGRYIVSGSHDQTVRVWDAASGGEVAVLRGHGSVINTVAATRDGRHLERINRAL